MRCPITSDKQLPYVFPSSVYLRQFVKFWSGANLMELLGHLLQEQRFIILPQIEQVPNNRVPTRAYVHFISSAKGAALIMGLNGTNQVVVVPSTPVVGCTAKRRPRCKRLLQPVDLARKVTFDGGTILQGRRQA